MGGVWQAFAFGFMGLRAQGDVLAVDPRLPQQWRALEVRVQFRKRDRPEIEELTGQRWVPVLVHEGQAIHDSHRILEYLDWLAERREVA